ncbi:MAG TPA: hypothetical protein VH914_21465 [Acidimicrobiia bacterium]|nr:hypothetical protein [Acidimicrobiia bacterium]
MASRCDASWDDMDGDDRVRHCAGCDKDVYNLSGMSRDDAEALLAATGVDVCIRLYRRADGTVITRDCGTRARPWSRAAAAVGLAALTLGATACMGKRATPRPRIVTISDDGDATLRVTLRATHAATLYVDGYELPLGATLEVEPGQHEVTVMSDGREIRQSVVATPGNYLNVVVDVDHD